MEEITPAHQVVEQPENLLFALCQPSESEPSLPVPSSFPALPSEFHPAQPFRAPLPHPSLVNAVHNWLITRSASPEEIPSAKALVECVDLKDTGGIRSRLKLFRATARLYRLPPTEIPCEDDFRQARNHPRIYASLAHVARAIDADGWNAVLQDTGANHPSNWRDAMIDEPWMGDQTAREFLKIFGDCTIVVAGSQGSGKSATVGTILNRPSLPQSHALIYITPTESMTDAERSKVDKLRHLAHINWPDLPIERNSVTGSNRVERCHVKIGGKVLSFIELPSLEAFAEGNDGASGMVEVRFGKFETIVKELEGERPHLLFLVERLDDVDEQRLAKVIGKMQRLFGRSVFSRMVVILTHGDSLAGGMCYNVWAFEQTKRVEAVLQKFVRELKPVPIVVMENSHNCRRVSGHRVLPDGTDFVDNLLQKVTGIAQNEQEGTELTPLPIQRWWEKFALRGNGNLYNGIVKPCLATAIHS